MSKEEIRLKMLERRLKISKSIESLDTLLDIINTSAPLQSFYWWKPSYILFKQNNRLFIRLYSPCMTRIREMTKAFEKAGLLGYLEGVGFDQEYADFVIYFRRIS